jgi:small GTP-binding protein
MPKSNLEKSKKFRQALKKVIATGLSVLTLTPMTKSFIPSTLKAFKVGKNKNKKDDENNSNIEQNNQVSETEVEKDNKNHENSLKNKFKNLSAEEKILAFGTPALVVLGFIAFLAKKLNSGDIPKNQGKKIVFIGDSQSGKTALIERIFSGVFNKNHNPTVGALLFSAKRTFNDQEVQLNFWDVAGGEKFKCLAPMYYKAADLVLIFIDSSKNINDQLDYWLENFKNITNSEVKGMVILSRLDLSKDIQKDIESKKQIITQKINVYELNERVTLFKDPISNESITNENIQELESEIYRIIAS